MEFDPDIIFGPRPVEASYDKVHCEPRDAQEIIGPVINGEVVHQDTHGPAGSQEPDWDRIRTGHERFGRALERVQRISETNPSKAKPLVRQVVQSRDAGFFAVHENRNSRWRQDSHSDYLRNSGLDKFDAYAWTGGLIRVRLEAKQHGGFRVVTAISRHCPQETLWGRILRFNMAPRSLVVRQRVDAFDAAFLAWLLGFRYVVCGDVADCHLRLDPRRLKGITALPGIIVDRFIAFPPLGDRRLRWLGDQSQQEALQQRVYGRGFCPIRPGGGIANDAANVLLSDMIASVGCFARGVIYGDDFLLFCQTYNEAVALKDQISAVARTRTFGDLDFRHLDIADFTSGFDFLGLRFWIDKGTPQMTLSRRGRARMEAKLREHLCHPCPFEAVTEYLKRWQAQMLFWPAAGRFARTLRRAIFGADPGGNPEECQAVVAQAMDIAMAAPIDRFFRGSNWFNLKLGFIENNGRLPSPYEFHLAVEDAVRRETDPEGWLL